MKTLSVQWACGLRDQTLVKAVKMIFILTGCVLSGFLWELS